MISNNEHTSAKTEWFHRDPAAKERDKRTYQWLFLQSKTQHLRIVVLSLLCTVQAAVLVGFALACRAVIDSAVAGNMQDLIWSSVVLAAIIVAQLLLRIAVNSMQEYIRARLAVNMRQSILGALLSCNYGSALKYHSGELSNRMFSDVQVVTNGTSLIVPSFVSMAMQLVFAIVVLAFMSPEMVLLFVAAAVLSFALARIMRTKMKHLHKDVQEKEGLVRTYLQEALEHQLVIRSFGAQDATNSRASQLQENHFTSQMRRRGYSIAANASFSFFFSALYVISLVWCSYELLQGTMSYGTLMAVLQLVSRIQTPISNLSGLLPQLYQTLASAERLIEITELPKVIGRLPLSTEAFYEKLKGLAINHMSFVYDDAEEGDQSLACEKVFVPKGSFVVVTGPSGSGKSTLFKLALGAYDAEGFAYQLEGEKACCASQAPAGSFAYVPQDNFLFAGTVRENVAFVNEEATDEQIQQACEIACAWEFVEALPQGIDTVLGEHGQGLSQGQLQRLAIARAVCSGAPIMVLDEVTSALDNETEARVLRNIAALSGRTVFVAAHRAKAIEFGTCHLSVDGGVLRQLDDARGN